MKRRLFILFALLFAALFGSAANATEVNMSWSWPTQYCDGEPLPATDLQSAEIYVSDAPIPRVPSACNTGDVDTPPSGAIIANVPVSDTSTSIDLQCGKTYHFVIRVQVASGAWSNFSGEATKDLVCGRPNVPVIVILT